MSETVKKRGRPKKTVDAVPDKSVINKTDMPDETVNAIVKQRKHKPHTRPNRSEALKVHTEPGEMSRLIMNSMGLRQMGLVEIDVKNPEAVRDRINDFLEYCISRDIKPTVESMALAFGIDRITLWRWKEGLQKDMPDASRAELKRGYDLMNELLTQTMNAGKVNPVSAIFLLKNNHAYRDQTEVVVTPNTPYENANPDDIRDKYIEGVADTVQTDGKVE